MESLNEWETYGLKEHWLGHLVMIGEMTIEEALEVMERDFGKQDAA